MNDDELKRYISDAYFQWDDFAFEPYRCGGPFTVPATDKNMLGMRVTYSPTNVSFGCHSYRTRTQNKTVAFFALLYHLVMTDSIPHGGEIKQQIDPGVTVTLPPITLIIHNAE